MLSKCVKWLKTAQMKVLTDPRKGVETTPSIPEKFLLFAILALNSQMIFLEVLLS